ncbi:MAG: 50S ribosomal protein L10 [Bacteroidia bacterium]|nr:50S ribosomal protein L10 [Bacteroidia bacterium]
MTKEQKNAILSELTEVFAQNPNFYVLDTSGLPVSKINKFRALCFNSKLKLRVAKNTLIKKALERQNIDYSGVFPALKQSSAVLFIDENISEPAKMLQKFRGKAKSPALKGAFIDSAIFLGDESIKDLSTLKSKSELIGEVIAMLQSPAQNVISALQSGGSNIAGILKTLSERSE